jgi:invasion protein IalB
MAQDVNLPGGATSLREVHGDWIVNCFVAKQGDQPRKVCTIAYELRDHKSGQRVAALEMQPSSKTNTATLALPFGLDLGAGVQLQIDNGTRGQTQAFRTCLPIGCIVPVPVDAKMLAALRAGTILKVYARPDGMEEASFSLSLKGFGSAFDRSTALAK